MWTFVTIAALGVAGIGALDPSCYTPILLPGDNVTQETLFPPETDPICAVRPSEYPLCKFPNTQNMREVLRAFMNNEGFIEDLFFYMANSDLGIMEYNCYRANATYTVNADGGLVFTFYLANPVDASPSYTYTVLASGALQCISPHTCYEKLFKSFAIPTCVKGSIMLVDCRLDSDTEVDFEFTGRMSSLATMTDADIAQINSQFPAVLFTRNSCANI